MTVGTETDALGIRAEEQFGIRADLSDLQKLRTYILETYGGMEPAVIKNVFLTGEAAEFLTVSETYFFREPAHFSFLRELLPAYKETGLRICCAAVSSGCEAYSIAMLIETYNRTAEEPLRYFIDAFDINRRVIDSALLGLYGPRVLREDGSQFHYITDHYLQKTADGYRIDPSLKKNIHFFIHNLMDKLQSGEYDVIFFRNAFIYFTPGSRDRILSNLISVLAKESILIMGVSETLGVSNPGIVRQNRNGMFYFKKRTPFTEVRL
ncbi:MAG: hypothetical protein FWD78_10520 [Treponema sp.]|nr:hypothetical protein [Treponema sp.]